MIESTYYPKPRTHFSTGFFISLLGHGILIGFFAFEAFLFTSEKIDFTSAVRVDLVALPDKLPPPAAQPTPPAESTKPQEVTPPAPVEAAKPPEPLPVKKPVVDKDTVKIEKNTKKKQQSAIEKLKAMEALNKIKEDVKKDNLKTANKSQPIKGAVLSPGTALTGINKLQEQNYISQLDQHIKANWALPSWLQNKGYRTQIRVQFDEKGNLVSRYVVKPSGNPTYDEMALATIDKSVPFPAPPEKFTSIFRVDGILIGFPE